MRTQSILGIDIAKLKLDVALISGSQTIVNQFENSPSGFKRLQAWLAAHTSEPVHACLEATGSYGEAVAAFLFEHGHQVSIVNPIRIKGYALSKLQRNKTDRSDARLIAAFCLQEKPSCWTPLPAEVAELQALTRRIEMLQEMLQMEQNRLDTTPAKTRPSILRIIKTLETEIANLQKSIKDHIDRHPDLKQQSELLQTIPGVGEKTSQLLLSEIDFTRYQSARQIAAFAGVTPRQATSGTSLNRTGLSKLGNGRIRKALYFPAIVAKTRNQIIVAFAARLEKNGKTQMQIVCAAMRKLLHIAFGVLKHRQPFDPNLAFNS